MLIIKSHSCTRRVKIDSPIESGVCIGDQGAESPVEDLTLRPCSRENAIKDYCQISLLRAVVLSVRGLASLH